MNNKILEAFAVDICRQFDDLMHEGKAVTATSNRKYQVDLVVSISKQFNPRFNESKFRKACGL